MFHMKKTLFTAMWCWVAVVTSGAARYTWQGGADTHYWSEPEMWKNDSTSEFGVPVSEDEVRIWGTGTTVITNGDVITTTTASLRYNQVVSMQGGTWNNIGGGDSFFVPWKGGTGTVEIVDGSLNVNGILQLGYGANCASLGLLKQYGGGITVDVYAVAGRHVTATGMARHVGGTMLLSHTGSCGYVVGEQGLGRLEIGGAASVSVNGDLGVWFYNRLEGAAGEVALSTGGMLAAKRITIGNSSGYLGAGCAFAFDGGTLKTVQDSDLFISVGGVYDTGASLTAFGVTGRGGTVDTDGHAVTFNQALTDADAIAPSNLVHRWSFNGDVRDSIGGTTATLDGSVSLTNMPGSVKLPGGTHGTGAVDLGANLLPTGAAGFTIEVWATMDTLMAWTRCIEIGSKNDSTGADYFFCAWAGGKGFGYYGPTVGVYYGTRILPYSSSRFQTDTPYHIAVTAEPVGDGTWTVKCWRLVAGTGKIELLISCTAPSGWSPAVQNADHFWLGRSLAAADSDAYCSYDEVRVWNRPLTEWELVVNDFAGPDAVIADKPFVKAGAGTLTLTGENTYGVPTEVENGTLALASGSSLASDVLVKTGGVFAVAADATPPAIAIEVGENGASGYVAPTSGSLDLDRLSVSVANPDALENGRSYVICRSSGGFTGTLSATNVPGGWQTTIHNSCGEVRLVKSGLTIVIR